MHGILNYSNHQNKKCCNRLLEGQIRIAKERTCIAPKRDTWAEHDQLEKRQLPQGKGPNVNFPSASDMAWHRALFSLGDLPTPCGQLTSETSSEYRYMWTPKIGLPCQ